MSTNLIVSTLGIDKSQNWTVANHLIGLQREGEREGVGREREMEEASVAIPRSWVSCVVLGCFVYGIGSYTYSTCM